MSRTDFPLVFYHIIFKITFLIIALHCCCLRLVASLNKPNLCLEAVCCVFFCWKHIRADFHSIDWIQIDIFFTFTLKVVFLNLLEIFKRFKPLILVLHLNCQSKFEANFNLQAVPHHLYPFHRCGANPTAVQFSLTNDGPPFDIQEHALCISP